LSFTTNRLDQIGGLVLAIAVIGTVVVALQARASIFRADVAPTTISIANELPESPDEALGSLDQLIRLSGGVRTNATRFEQRDLIIANGWIADGRTHSPGRLVLGRVDEALFFACRTHTPRIDVSVALHEPRFARVGYECAIPAKNIPPGRHVLQMTLVDEPGLSLVVLKRAVAFEIRAAPAPSRSR